MQKTIQYVAEEGERWDTISFKMYGTVAEVPRLIDANPHLQIKVHVEGGTLITVPVLQIDEVATTGALPPWKRT